MQVLTLTKYIEKFYDGEVSEFKKDWYMKVKEPSQWLVITMCGHHRLVQVRAVKNNPPVGS